MPKTETANMENIDFSSEKGKAEILNRIGFLCEKALVLEKTVQEQGDEIKRLKAKKTNRG